MNFDGKKFRRAVKNFRRAKLLKNFPRKILRRGIFLRKSLQLVQVAVIEVVKDFVQLRLENFEVNEHSELVQIVTANNRLDLPIMPVQPLTFAVIAANEMCRLERRTNIYLVQNFSISFLVAWHGNFQSVTQIFDGQKICLVNVRLRHFREIFFRQDNVRKAHAN